MTRRMRATLVTFCAVCSCTALAAADGPAEADRYWPQWRGPRCTGVAPLGDPPTKWSETEHVRWKTAIPGRGSATPIIWGDRVYLLTAIKTDRLAADDAARRDSAELAGGERPAAPAAPDTSAVAAWLGSGTPPTANLVAFAPIPSQDAPQERERRDPPPGNEERRPPPGDGQARAPREGQDRPPPGGQDRPRRGGGMRGETPKNVVEFHVLAIDRKTGKTVWDTKVHEQIPHEGTHPDGTFASASPVTDGEHVYAHFGSYGQYCLDRDGKVVWKSDLGDMRTRNSFGEGSSPALRGDTLVINWDEEGDDFIVAIDKRTGKERWRQKRDEPTSWATPLIADVAGKAQVITSARNRLRSYDLETGDIVWECAGLTENVIPSPVAADGTAYLISGFRGASLKAVRLAEAKGDITDSRAITWTYDKETPYVPSPLLFDGYLYFLDNNRAILSCLVAKDGTKRFGPLRLEGLKNIYASPVAAAGRVYIADRDGKTLVFEPGDEPKVLAVNELDDSFDASPAIVGKELFLRGAKNLYCIAAD